jgi:hypothetical protein
MLTNLQPGKAYPIELGLAGQTLTMVVDDIQVLSMVLMEALLRQHALTADLAVTFQHEDLLRPEDLTRLFPMRRQLAFDRRPLLASYTDLCHRQCTSDRVIAINLGWAETLLDTLGDLGAISQEAIEAWTANARDQFPHHTRADGKALGKWSYRACFLLIRQQNLLAQISRIGVHRVACT